MQTNWSAKWVAALILAAVLGAGIVFAQAQSSAPGKRVSLQASDVPAAPAPGPAKESADQPAPAAAADGDAPIAGEPQDDAAIRYRGPMMQMRSITNAQRKAAADRWQQSVEGRGVVRRRPLTQPYNFTTYPSNLYMPVNIPGVYTNASPGNWAFSPLPPPDGTQGMLKFRDSLAGLGPANASTLTTTVGLTQRPVFIPVASPLPTCGGGVTSHCNPFGDGSDFYEIGLVDYQQRMHSNLPATGTHLRGYIDKNPSPNPAYGVAATIDANGVATTGAGYLGPVIIAQRNKATRIKAYNLLKNKLLIPYDLTVMGAGQCITASGGTGMHDQNRAVIHLHGGDNPWISDGTPHQWFTPAGSTSANNPCGLKGSSFQNVPDMVLASGQTDPYGVKFVPDQPSATVTDGLATQYYPNGQSARLMFYHDHAWGTTRINVYAGEAAGYLLWDTNEDALIGDYTNSSTPIPDNSGADQTRVGGLPLAGGGLYRYGIPLVIQDKSFVPTTAEVNAEDPTWATLTNAGQSLGDLWFPHVYMPNQNPGDDSGANPKGRWDYGPWFWPPMIGTAAPKIPPLHDNNAGIDYPATTNPSLVPEAFMDTPVVNGVAYPYITVAPKAYRFRILNAANDRYWNLGLYKAAASMAIQVTDGGSGYSTVPAVTLNPVSNGAAAHAVLTGGVVTSVVVDNPGSGYLDPPTVTIDPPGGAGTTATAVATVNTEVKMADAFPRTASSAEQPCATDLNVDPAGLPHAIVTGGTILNGTGMEAGCWPNTWPTDGRDGGVPDPTMAGPAIIQIGTEGGMLPAPVVIPSTPTNYNYNRRDIVVLNVNGHGLWVGPAERADVIIDFSQFAGKTLILYNDSPAPVPAFDTRNDYYTGNPDQTSTGGAPSTQAGYGPNTRTIMQFRVLNTTPAAPYNTSALEAALPVYHKAAQGLPLVPEPAFDAAYNNTGTPAVTPTYSRIQYTALTYKPYDATLIAAQSPTVKNTGLGATITMNMVPKTIQELFTLDYGKMNATLGTELPLTNFNNQTTVPLAYIDPPTEIIRDGETQIWKITHNGVDTHTVHFHLFNVQVLNRVGWDGAIRAPDANEIGWKEAVRMNPLEDIIVALKPIKPATPSAWGALPNSVRLLNPAGALNSTADFSQIDPLTGNAPVPLVANVTTNFGWEYVWHCHLLGHEENDMMRPIVFMVDAPTQPTLLTATVTPPTQVRLQWGYVPPNPPAMQATNFQVWRGTTLLATIPIGITSYTDNSGTVGNTYVYRVVAVNIANVPNTAGCPNPPPAATTPDCTITASAPSNNVSVTLGLAPPTNLRVNSLSKVTGLTLAWNGSPSGVTKFNVYRKTGTGSFTVVGSTPVFSQTQTVFTFKNIGLTTGTTYYYYVTAVPATGAESAPSNTVTVVGP